MEKKELFKFYKLMGNWKEMFQDLKTERKQNWNVLEMLQNIKLVTVLITSNGWSFQT